MVLEYICTYISPSLRLCSKAEPPATDSMRALNSKVPDGSYRTDQKKFPWKSICKWGKIREIVNKVVFRMVPLFFMDW